MEIEPWPNNMGLKMMYYWETLREHIKNLKIVWEPNGNTK